MNKSFNVDNLKVVISDNPNNMGRAAAEAIHRDINDLLAVKEEISIMFAAAPSQNTTLAFLSSYDDIEWRRVRVFHMDEYIGPAEDSPNSFRYYLNSHFWSGRLCKAKYQIMGDGYACIDDVPKQAITVTIPGLLSAAIMHCVVPGRLKAAAVDRTLFGEISEGCPASILRKHKNATLYIDEDSADLIKGKIDI